MPTIPKPVLIVSAIIQTVVGNFINVSYWLPVTAPTSGTDVDSMCGDFNGVFGPLYGTCLCSGITYLGCMARYLNGSTELEGANATPTAGSAAGVNVSDQNAVVIRKVTGMGGRQNRGRYFIGGLSSLAFSPANPDEVENITALPAYRALAAQYGSDQTLAGIVCHARHWDRKDSVLRVITECRVSSRIASRDDRRRHAINVPE
jgi:hypothetical protein